MNELPCVAVFGGGMSPEHDISVLSAREVFNHIPRDRWAPILVFIHRDGRWAFPPAAVDEADAPAMSFADGMAELIRRRPVVVFPLLHGAFGEDGRFQGLLDYAGLSYVGSGCLSSALALNKARARDVLVRAGLRVPEGEELRAGEAGSIGAPCVIKPMHLGSSVGLRIAHTEAERQEALEHAFAHDDHVLVEEFVTGREFTAGVLEQPNGPPVALPIIEIRPKTSAYFDFHAKYTPGATEEICPAPIDDTLRDQIQAIGLRAHRILGCRTMSRTDIIVGEDGVIYALETNTLPGMTATSLLPQAAAVHGLPFPELLHHMLTVSR